MLIYNFQKEFLGIDEKDLHTLGYKDLAELRTEVTDFADLFVKTPGYIHNFQHVHWIDFITCAQSNEESKVIINANSKSYRAIITITNAYLVDNPSQKAYLVHLNNLRALTTQEYDNISGDIIQKPIPEAAPKTVQTITPKKEENVLIQDEYDIPLNVEEDLDKMLDVGDLSIHTQAPEKPVEKVKEPVLETEPQLHVTPQKEYVAPKQALEEQPKNTYVFDPHIASKELGLPLDLIEEFIQDFIDQANDFKNGLYTALDEGDINNVKILSHKLKGVAANLRIEDAHEVLSIVNAASDADVIKTNLDNFYNIIARLSGEETLTPIKDEEVPQKIEVPELLDDEFIAPDDEKLEIMPEEPEELLEFKEEEIAEETPLEIQEKEAEPILEFKEEPEIETEPESALEIETQSEEKYSKEKTANEIGLDLESFNELFEDFIKEAFTIFKKINEAVSANDYETLKRQALKLKGMSDNMRMHAFTNELETLIHSTDKDAIAQAVTQIDNVLTTISKEED